MLMPTSSVFFQRHLIWLRFLVTLLRCWLVAKHFLIAPFCSSQTTPKLFSWCHYVYPVALAILGSYPTKNLRQTYFALASVCVLRYMYVYGQQ